MANVRVSCVLWAMLILAMTPATGLAQWQLGSAPSFSSGKYGTDTRTEVLYMPISARRLFGDGDLTLVFPFTCIRGNGNVTVVNGAPVRQEPVRGGTTTPTRGGATPPGRGGTSTSTSGTVTTGAATADAADDVRACGAGDIVVRGRYYVVDEHGAVPTIALRAHVKAPTASAERGIGTGKPDEGFGIEVSRTLPGAILAMVDVGYTIIGKPAGVDFRNSWWYDVGVGKNLASGTVNLSVFFEEYSAIVPGFVNARDVLAAMNINSAGGWRLQISGELGLSDGAPDHGLTFGLNRRF